MSDLSSILPTTESAESIPAALAAPKQKRGKVVKAAATEPFAASPATFPGDTSSSPTAAVPADLQHEEPVMAVDFENAAATATEKTQEVFAGMKDQAKSTMEKGAAAMSELNSFTKGNVEALVESGKIAIAGMQTMAQDQAAYVRKQFEEATTAAKTLASLKSPTDFVKMQGDFMRSHFDAMVAETSRSTEAALKLVGEVVQPISNRFALAAEKIKQAA